MGMARKVWPITTPGGAYMKERNPRGPEREMSE